MALCPSCGDSLKYDIVYQRLKCVACQNTYDPYELDHVTEAETNTDVYGVNIFSCPQCGGEIASTEHDLTGRCSFCGSDVMFSSRMENTTRPKYIIPFKITKEDCKRRYLEKIKEYKYAPKDIKDAQFIDGFRGIYVPYWLYQTQESGTFRKEATIHRSDSKYVYTDYYLLSGDTSATFDEIPHDASTVLFDDISERVEPYELQSNGQSNLQPFTPSFLSGFYAEPTDVEPHKYHKYAENISRDVVATVVSSRGDFDKFGSVSFNDIEKKNFFNVDVTNAELALLPIWFLSYRKNNRVAYAAINGQTGRVMCDIPVDFKKSYIGIIIAAIVSFFALNFFTVQATMTTMLAVLLSLAISMYFKADVVQAAQSAKQTEASTDRKSGSSTNFGFAYVVLILLAFWGFELFSKFDNELAASVNTFSMFVIAGIGTLCHLIYAITVSVAQSKLPKGCYTRFPYHWLSFIAGCIGTGALFLGFVHDSYYYVCAAIIIIVEVITLTAIIKNYNKITMNPLPQFELHKGGDDRA